MTNEQQPFTDQVSLIGDEANVYEAIATLEFLGRPVGAADIVSSTGLDRAIVGESLQSMTERGLLIETEQDGHKFYEPSHRGWSAAPEQSAGPQR